MSLKSRTRSNFIMKSSSVYRHGDSLLAMSRERRLASWINPDSGDVVAAETIWRLGGQGSILLPWLQSRKSHGNCQDGEDGFTPLTTQNHLIDPHPLSSHNSWTDFNSWPSPHAVYKEAYLITAIREGDRTPNPPLLWLQKNYPSLQQLTFYH